MFDFAKGLLKSALSNSDHEIRVAAARTLGLLDEKLPDIIDVLLPLLSDLGRPSTLRQEGSIFLTTAVAR